MGEKQLKSCGDEFYIDDIAEPIPCGYTLKGTIPCNEICNNLPNDDLSDDEDLEGSGSGDFFEVKSHFNSYSNLQ